MSEHFIKEIGIKNYKCFADFKAQGFARVNLIGGKNNVGKTAFMEACYLYSSVEFYLKNAPDYRVDEISTYVNKNREELNFKFIESLIFIEQMRNKTYFFLDWIREEFDLSNVKSFEISQKYVKIINNDGYITLMQENKDWNYGVYNLFNFRENKYFSKLFKKNNLPLIENKTFISFCDDLNASVVDELKLNGQYSYINQLLKDIFNLDMIDNIKNQIMVQEDGKYLSLSEFGDGLKNFVHIVIVLLSYTKRAIFIDEIENGIHYTKLDDMWRVILKLSIYQDIQIFATTHSKECIESYARVSKELSEEEIAFIELGRDKEDKLKAIVMNSSRFYRELQNGNGVRGW